MKQFGLAIAVVAAAILAAPAVAQQKVPVQFAKGASSATIKGTISGDQYRDYIVNARAGQQMSVTLTNPDGRAFFNVMGPGSSGEAVFTGQIAGNSFKGPVPGTGATTIRVYQMRATGRRGEVANYTLAISVGGGGSASSGAGGAGGAAYKDIVGMEGYKAVDVMASRGFASVDNFQSGSDLGAVWWNARTRQCIQTISVNSRIDSAVDIRTHPKCR